MPELNNNELSLKDKVVLIAVVFALGIVFLAFKFNVDSFTNNILTAGIFIATVTLVSVAYLQLKGINITCEEESKHNQAEFIFNFSKDFFTKETRIIIMLIDKNAIEYNETQGCFRLNESVNDILLDIKDRDLIKDIYSVFEIDDFIGHFDDIGSFLKKGMIDITDVCNYFGWYINTCWHNEEIRKYLDTQKPLFKNFEYIAGEVSKHCNYQKASSAKLPHDGAYTRMKPSKIHGVGVFAIRNIPKDTYIFSGDNSNMVCVDKSVIEKQEVEIRKLYDDFCIIKGNKYYCPDNFNNMNVGWYLNESKDNPNVRCDNNYDFYAIRDIEKGEELTVDYSTFSDYPE
jgi:hypothetical protein